MSRRSNRQIGIDWEDDVKQFFRGLGFNVVDGGDNFRPGGKPIDFVAGMGGSNVLFIGECKTKQELGRKYLKKDIEDFRKKTINAIKELSTYRGGAFRNFTHFVLLIVTKDIVWTEADKSALRSPLNENPLKAEEFDQSLVEYYDSIKDELSEDISRYHLFADFNIKFHSAESLEIPAFKNKINGFTCYNFTVTPQKILPYVTVARRQARKKEYYQRMISGSRCQSIINYIDNKVPPLFREGHIIPGNIIIATRFNTEIEDPEFENKEIGDSELVKLKLPNQYGVFWIVDGQHRLYSYSKNSTSRPQRSPTSNDRVFVTLLHQSNVAQQRQIFVDINDKQKGVDACYIIDIAGEADPTSVLGIISNVIKKVDTIDKVEEVNNYFYNKIKIPSHGLSNSRKFSLTGLKDVIDRKKLILPKISTNAAQNPFFRGVDRRTLNRINEAINQLAKSLALFLSIAINKDEEISEQTGESTPYGISSLLNSRVKEGLIWVLVALYERILVATQRKNRGKIVKPTKEDFDNYITPIVDHLREINSQEKLLEFLNTAGLGNRDNSVRRMCSILVAKGFREFDFDDLDFEINDIVQSTEELEGELRELINYVISKIHENPNWCKGKSTDILPGGIYNSLLAKAKGDIGRNPKYVTEGKLYKGLDLGQINDMIIKENNWKSFFSEIFVVGGDKFKDVSQFKEAIHLLGLYRNSKDHSRVDEEERRLIKSPAQKNIARGYLNIFKKISENFSGTEVVTETEVEDST